MKAKSETKALQTIIDKYAHLNSDSDDDSKDQNDADENLESHDAGENLESYDADAINENED